ncbi:hypothetical protein EYR40_002067 [Pleurotus pulmonarius]|nr:hypothetical protein EYR36_011533 [Pleurotus pulmonarius]KAF4585230.1 hypothetical protein EYR40_002067 [Pleurotus pulmonarius]
MTKIFETLLHHNAPRHKVDATINSARSDFPWKDVQQRLAAHCAESTKKFMRNHPPRRRPVFAPPNIALDTFIERLIRDSGAPLSAALAALATLGWTLEAQSCPVSSSSPHHLFLAAYHAVSQSLYECHHSDKEWAGLTGKMISYKQMALMRSEMASGMSMKGPGRGNSMNRNRIGSPEWDLLRWLVREDMSRSIKQLFEEERVQVRDDIFEAARMKAAEHEMVESGRLVAYAYGPEDEDEPDLEPADGFIVYR